MNINTKISDVAVPPQVEPVNELAENLTQPVKLFSTYAESHSAPTPNIATDNIEPINIDIVNDDYLHQDLVLSLSDQQLDPQGTTQNISLVANLPDTTPDTINVSNQADGSVVEELISSSTISNEIQTPLSASPPLSTNLTQQLSEDITSEIISPKDINNVITNSLNTNSETPVQPNLPTAQIVATNVLESNILTAQTNGLTEQVITNSTPQNTETDVQSNTPTIEPVARELTLATAVTPQLQNQIDPIETVQIASSAQKDIQSYNPVAELVPLKEPTVPANTPQLLAAPTQDNVSTHALASNEAIKTDPATIIPQASLDAAAPLAAVTSPVTSPVADTLVRVPQTANVATTLPTSHPAIQTVAQNLVKVQETQSGISVRLDPPEMGRVYIDFQFDTDRTVTATIRSDVAETAVALKDKAEFFQQILKENGFDSVSLNFEQNNTSQDNGSDSFDQSPSFSTTGSELEEATSAALPAKNLYKLSPETAIDIKL